MMMSSDHQQKRKNVKDVGNTQKKINLNNKAIDHCTF